MRKVEGFDGGGGYEVTGVTHRALGPLRRLVIEGGGRWDLTPDEASILSRALAAVREGRSEERTIFMSPIACDDEFSALVEGDGLVIGGARLPWETVAGMAGALGVSVP